MKIEEFRKAGISIKDIPQAERSRELCEVAVREDGDNLQYVPLPLRTVRLTKLAVGSKPKAYRFAPHGIRVDYDLTTCALRRGGLAVWNSIPPEIVDYDLCLAGVKGCGGLLKVIPGRLKTFDLCRLAFAQGGADLNDVPADFLDDGEFWRGVALKHIPNGYKTYERCMAGVRKCGNHLQYVSDDTKDILLCLAAVAQNDWACRFIPARFHANPVFQASLARARASGAPFAIETLAVEAMA